MEPEDIGVVPVNQHGRVEQIVIGVKDIKTHPTFANLLRIELGMLQEITQSMCDNGFFPTHPIVLGTWPGQDEPVVIDGHTRLQAALEAGVKLVAVVILAFEDEMAALQRAVSLQAQRRASTDGAFYRMCERYDRLMARGGDRRSEEAKSKMQRCIFDRRLPASAKRTGQLIGCDYRKVDKIRKIRRDGWPEIQEAVRNDEMSINKAYKLIRDMELGNDDNGKRLAAAHIKAAKTLLSEKNFAFLDQLGGDAGNHVNKALEMYMRWLRDQEGSP